MPKPSNRYLDDADIQSEWPELELPNRCLASIAKRNRENMLAYDPGRLGRRSHCRGLH